MNKNVLFAMGALTLAFLAPIPSTYAADGASSAPPAELLYSVSYVQSNLKKNKTTRAEVIASFGEPTHSKVRASDSGASETFYYQKNAGAKAKKKGMFGGGGLRGLAQMAGGVAEMVGYNKTGVQIAQAANQANRVAGGMDTIAAAGGGAAPQEQQVSGASILTIEIVDGIVTSYTLE